MASLILLFSELVRSHEWDAAALLAAYPPPPPPPSSCSTCAAALRRNPFKDEGGIIMQNQNNSQRTEEVENPLESRGAIVEAKLLDLKWLRHYHQKHKKERKWKRHWNELGIVEGTDLGSKKIAALLQKALVSDEM